MLESRSGVYWIATNGNGVSRFNPSESARGGNLFTTYSLGDETSNKANVIFEDHAGNVLVGTDNGLFRLNGGDINGTFQRVEMNIASELERILEVYALVE